MTASRLKVLITNLIIFIYAGINAQDHNLLRNTLENSGNTIVLSDGNKLLSNRVISMLYNGNDYNFLWSEKQNREDLLKNIIESEKEGLLPEDYHRSKIKSYLDMDYKKMDEKEKTNLDLLLSDALIHYGAHLNSGKVKQSELNREWSVDVNPFPNNPDSLIMVHLSNKNISGLLDSLKPQTFLYEGLKKALTDYQNIASKGGWPKMSAGETLKKGMSGSRVIELKNYLIATGDYKGSQNSSDINDDELEKAVINYQKRFNLTEDGIVGKGVLAEMNIPVEGRINQIRVNLERSRWVLHKLSDDFLVVNIAGFYIKRITNGKSVFYSRVIVGKNHHQTPIFKDELQYIELNPTWTLPYSIATNETLPKLKKDPGYLTKQSMEIYDKSGNKLNPANIDFSSYSKGNFPFTIVQTPGPHNALGEVKFMFPNQYSIYLHDTPSRNLFGNQDRAYSHGCIRLDDKWGLFLNLMKGSDWDQAKIDDVIATRKTTRVTLEKPIDIYLLYWTAIMKDDQSVGFTRDVYGRDEDVLKILDKPLN
jgi:murein L,D-transpeptidase YcbB/YkuD